MASQVDTSFPPDNTKVSKADMRDQFRTIADEISALQQKSTLACRLMLKDFEEN